MKPILSSFRSVLSKGQMKMYLCDKMSALWRVCHFLHPLNKAAVWFFFFQLALCFVFKTIWAFRPLVIQLPERLEQMCSASRSILMQPGHWFTPQWERRGNEHIQITCSALSTWCIISFNHHSTLVRLVPSFHLQMRKLGLKRVQTLTQGLKAKWQGLDLSHDLRGENNRKNVHFSVKKSWIWTLALHLPIQYLDKVT